MTKQTSQKKSIKTVKLLIILDEIKHCHDMKEKSWGLVCKANKKVRRTHQKRKLWLSKCRRRALSKIQNNDFFC